MVWFVGLAALASACGGASEERVSALEARVAQLSRGGTESSSPADNDRLTAIEQQLSVVQREVANSEQPHSDMPTPPAATAAPPTSRGVLLVEAMTWANADALLGAEVGGVTAANDGYTVNRVWLAREVAAMQNPMLAPKLLPTAGGVVIRVIKPKSAAAQLGLQNADVITAIDDHPVSKVADIASALHASRNGQAHVKLLRKKREVTLDYKLVD